LPNAEIAYLPCVGQRGRIDRVFFSLRRKLPLRRPRYAPSPHSEAEVLPRQAVSAQRAFVILDGAKTYLGRYGTQESRDNYDRVIGEWISRGRSRFVPAHAALPAGEGIPAAPCRVQRSARRLVLPGGLVR